MSCFSSMFMPAIGSSSRRIFGSAASARPSSTRFCSPYGRRAHRGLADVLDLEKLDDLLDRLAALGFFPPGAGQLQGDLEKGGVHAQIAARHDVVQHRHALEQSDVLEGPGDAELGGVRRLHARQALASKGDAAFLGDVDAIDDVEHRALAGTVRADDRPHFVLEHVEADVGQRLDAAEPQRDRVELENRRADGKGALRRRQDGGDVQAALLICPDATTFASRIFDVRLPALDIDAHLPAAVVHGVDEGAVALGDDATAQLAGAGQHAVIGAEFAVQDDKAVDLRFRQRRLLRPGRR